MFKRLTTRISEPILKLVVNKACSEKKPISDVIAEAVASAMTSSENDEILLLTKSVAELTSSLSSVQKEFLIHKEMSQREFQMILNVLIFLNEIAKRVLSKDEYEVAWDLYQTKQKEYSTTNRIHL
ncbi:MAG TPA: hypothetical protein PLG94_09975 [Smithellaceae bacterium]|nr:hypothetical protein [Paludibacter sp.]HPL66850.1 hypothetical protein [Smithellaceae bacterium]